MNKYKNIKYNLFGVDNKGRYNRLNNIQRKRSKKKYYYF